MTLTRILKSAFVSSAVLCAGLAAAQTPDPALQAALASSFRAEGIAGLDRINQDPIQAFCSDPSMKSSPQGQAKMEALQKASLAEIKPPTDGKYLGDWKRGETLAQNGRGATWSDAPGTPNGGSCYNCHQIDPKEISFGNIGPSLTGYGKTRGAAQPVLEYTWNRISNSKAFNACSNMPRFAHFGLLTEQQIKDVMALLLDPASPVNR